ncbi:MAG: hypothetical protein E7Z87_02345 [Cyanobacteria bacterium SIG26]|nr:hypothetical protein [Cyanobacteria bacterium SIG26]
MTKFLNSIFLFLLLFFSLTGCSALADENVLNILLRGSVVAVPKVIYGSWRVMSKRIDTNAPTVFKIRGIDFWNLSQENDVIVLSNPFSGASADIKIENVTDNSVVFTKTGRVGNKILTDKVSIIITAENFEGYDELRLDTISDVNGKIIKTETAKYSVLGEKISGNSVLE